MLSYNDLRAGTIFMLEGQPYEVLEYEFLRMQQRKPVAKTKIKNILTGKIVERNFHQNESFEEAEIGKTPIKYLYTHRDVYWFANPENPKERFSLEASRIGEQARFLKPECGVTAIRLNDAIIGVELPIKMDLKIQEAPPGERGNTAQGGSKVATLETGAAIDVPLFVNTGDTVRVNTQTGEYVERVEKNRE